MSAGAHVGIPMYAIETCMSMATSHRKLTGRRCTIRTTSRTPMAGVESQKMFTHLRWGNHVRV